MLYDDRNRAQDEEFSLKLHLTSSLEESVYRALSQARERKDIIAVSTLDEMRDWLDEQAVSAVRLIRSPTDLTPAAEPGHSMLHWWFTLFRHIIILCVPTN